MLFADSARAATAGMLSKIVLVVAATIASATLALASGPRAARRSDVPVVGPAPSLPGFYRKSDSTDRHPQHGHRAHQRQRPAHVIVIPPSYYYYSPYPFVTRPALVNAPFFCLEHGVGFISRVGLIDHLGGTHKLTLQHAAAICPEDVDTCVFEVFGMPYY
jgi:hypothetical protein